MIGERLKNLRTEKKLRQLDLADHLGVSRTTYTQYETNASEPDNDTLIRIATFFDVSLDFLLGRTDARKHIVDLPEDYTVDPDKLQVFMRASQTLPEEEMKKIREYAAMLIDKQIREEREAKKK